MRDLTDPTTYGAALREALDADRIGIGYYNEARPIYLADIFAIDNQQRRTIHLGVDLFAAPDTPMFAPLAGTVHSLADHPQQQDYGPTLILKHEAADRIFFTLYGHLSPTTLARWQVGEHVAAGDLIAHIGDYPRNGNWPPHLHFQIITDLLEYSDIFPRRMLAKITRPLDIAVARPETSYCACPSPSHRLKTTRAAICCGDAERRSTRR